MKKVWMCGICSVALSGCSLIEDGLRSRGWVKADEQLAGTTKVVHRESGKSPPEIKAIAPERLVPPSVKYLTSPPARPVLASLGDMPADTALAFTEIVDREPAERVSEPHTITDINSYYSFIEESFRGMGKNDVPFSEKVVVTRKGENIFDVASRVADNSVDAMHLAVALFESNRQINESKLRWRELVPRTKLNMPNINQLNMAKSDFEKALAASSGKNNAVVYESRTSVTDEYEFYGSDWIKDQGKGFILQYASTIEFDEIGNDVPVLYDGTPLVVYAFKQTKTGKPFYGLAHSKVYSSPNEAMAASDRLPRKLKKLNPWIRSVRDLVRDFESLGEHAEDVSDKIVVRIPEDAHELPSDKLVFDNSKIGINAAAVVTMAGVNYSLAVARRPTAQVVLDKPKTVRFMAANTQKDWQNTTSWSQTTKGKKKNDEYYVGVAMPKGDYTRTLKSNLDDYNPLDTVIEWRFQQSTTVGSAMQKVAEFIGYQVILNNGLVSEMYSRPLPVPHRTLSGLSVDEAFMLLGGQGFISVLDHNTRSVSHMPRREYVSAKKMPEGESLMTCPDDIHHASVLNGIGGNVFMLQDGTKCAY